ncbi:hypothetical protein [Teichococcus aestuarii]|uniref:hypothetical protein n=1 Tax=Teichococcus aestuarii TaxID=568898 RepID=UPI00361E291E
MISAAFYGTEGGAALRNVNGSFYDFTAERYRGTAREVLAAPPDAWGGRAAADWARRRPRGSVTIRRWSGSPTLRGCWTASTSGRGGRPGAASPRPRAGAQPA